MAYKVGGKKPQMNNASSIKTNAAMYASKTSMYGKPMMNGGPGDDEKKKAQEAQRAAQQRAKEATAFRQSMYSSDFGNLSKDVAKDQGKQDFYYGDNSDKGKSLKSLYASKEYSKFAQSQGGDSEELRKKVAGEFAFATKLGKSQFAKSSEGREAKLREGIAIAESLGRKRKN